MRRGRQSRVACLGRRRGGRKHRRPRIMSTIMITTHDHDHVHEHHRDHPHGRDQDHIRAAIAGAFRQLSTTCPALRRFGRTPCAVYRCALPPPNPRYTERARRPDSLSRSRRAGRGRRCGGRLPADGNAFARSSDRVAGANGLRSGAVRSRRAARARARNGDSAQGRSLLCGRYPTAKCSRLRARRFLGKSRTNSAICRA